MRAALPTTAELYVFGDSVNPLLRLNAQDDYGCLWLADEPEGWDSAEVLTTVDRRQDGHGGYVGQSWLSERVLSFDGMVVAENLGELRAARQRLQAAVQGNLGGQTLYTQLDDAPAKSLWLRPSGKLRARIVDSEALVFAFTMVAEDPLKFGQVVRYGPAQLAQAGDAGGLQFPVQFSAQFGGGMERNVLRIANDGDEAAPAVYTLAGPWPTPMIRLTNGQYLGLTLDLASNDVAVIDTRAGTLTVNGVSRYDALVPGSVFPPIPVGGTEVRMFSTTGGSSLSASLYVTTAPTWR